jgi:hypothetical protein
MYVRCNTTQYYDTADSYPQCSKVKGENKSFFLQINIFYKSNQKTKNQMVCHVLE